MTVMSFIRSDPDQFYLNQDSFMSRTMMNNLTQMSAFNDSTSVWYLDEGGLPGTSTTVGAGGTMAPPEGCLVVQPGAFVPWDNPDDILSPRTEFWISTILIGTVVMPLLSALGIVGNILTSAVFWQQGLGDRINFCLFSLAVVDLLVVITNFCLTAENVYRRLVGFSAFFITYFPGITGVVWVSQFLSAVISSERCICVVSPLHAQKFLKTSTMAVFIFTISALLLAGMLAIAGPKHYAVCMFNPFTNATEDIVGVTKYYQDNKKILDIFDIFFYATAFPTIFLLTVTITTSVTAIKLRDALAWRQQSVSTASDSISEQQSKKGKISAKEVALTKMLIATSILFIVCLLPILMVQIATFLVKDLNYDGRYYNLTLALWQCINAFRCLNSSLNFFIYYQMGSKFRQTLHQLFTSSCCWPKK